MGTNEVRPDFFREPPVKYTGGDLPWQWEEDGLVATRTGAWAAPGCHDGCGVVVYTDKETGSVPPRWRATRRAPTTKAACALAASRSRRRCTIPDRVLYPLRARPAGTAARPTSGSASRGTRPTRRIKEKFDAIKAESGAKAVVFHLGTGRGTAPYMTRLQYAFGSVQYAYMLSGNSCYVPRVGASNVLMGTYTVPDCSQNHYDRYDHEGWVPPQEHLHRGATTRIVSNADGNLGHWVVDCMKRGSRLVVVDPEAHRGSPPAPTSGCRSVAAPTPRWRWPWGSSSWRRTCTTTSSWSGWCYGFEEYYEATRGWTLERAAEVTWVPAEKIARAAQA